MRATRFAATRGLRSVSTSAGAPTVAKTEVATEGRGPLATGAILVTGIGAASAGTFAYVCRRYVDDLEFRRRMRKDLAAPSRYVEKFISDYMPHSFQALRIEDDLEEGEAEVSAAGPRPVGPRLPGGVILGGVPAPETISEGGRTLYHARAPAAEGGAPAGGAGGDGVAAPSLLGTRTSSWGPDSADAVPPDLPLGPMPADDDEADEGPDPLQWWAPREDAARVWSSAAPPSDALRLAVPRAAAERFEVAMRLFDDQCRRLFEEAGATAGLPVSGGATGEDVGSTDIPGLRVISMPEGFTTSPAVFYELADKAAGASRARARFGGR